MCIRDSGKSCPHGIVLEPVTPEEIKLYEKAAALFPKK
jgi:hypothetical protein